ncbi:polyphenol oxidase I, chloroplastic-like [Salvia miltiorrhiza]|uniref:polyphenol oxidase I, chloroplastic-like n=1 Tax=Salvia miltiorrhiza TaxID=226208 RepID=UPI0025AD64DD|nr:polyphenol oxidase I, chloroplastic-like [Salvia miltiorrhiza]
MASLPFSTFASNSQLSSRPILIGKPPHISTASPRLKVSCNVENGSQGGKVDRRNLLLGMGGLYGATNLVKPPALAAPISAPDLAKCSGGTNLNTQQPLDVNCCPPFSEKIIDYKLPPVTKLRLRPAAHLVTKEYIAKYEKATELMKALPDDDPRSFMQQANVHCAYCNLTYDQTGDPDQKLQIHNCWHFYPWHRWYLYFYERILGKLIDDPTFALPFWNWDHPDGMVMPAMFAKENSSLNDAKRNQTHLPPAPTDLLYSSKSSTDPSIIVPTNLTEMYGEMVRNVSNIEDFYGAKYVVGTAPDPGPGTVERGSHIALHIWVGDPRSPAGEDMGNFYSTARDPIFFCHHANVDRLWSVWRDLRGPKPKDFNEPEWLNADFVFYDENAQLVRVKVKDTLEDVKMGFTYQKVELPWLNKRPKARVRKSKIATTAKAIKSSAFPVKLDKVVKVLVDRPKTKRSKKEKEKEEELLVIEGIEVDTAKFVRFEVFVNDEDDEAGDIIDKAEYAGGYSQVPHKNSTKVKSKIRLGLTELLEDLDVEDDDKILVSLVPRAGGEDITIGGVKIIYV